MLPWGCHYCNLVSQVGHAWVAADLSADPQVKRATTEAAALSAAEERSQPTPALLAYSDGSVTANGALGSAAVILCVGTTHDVSAVVRLASADTALSSGRSEWTGLLLVLRVDLWPTALQLPPLTLGAFVDPLLLRQGVCRVEPNCSERCSVHQLGAGAPPLLQQASLPLAQWGWRRPCPAHARPASPRVRGGALLRPRCLLERLARARRPAPEDAWAAA